MVVISGQVMFRVHRWTPTDARSAFLQTVLVGGTNLRPAKPSSLKVARAASGRLALAAPPEL